MRPEDHQLYLRFDGANPLRTSPAMAVGMTSKLWEVSDLVRLEAADPKNSFRSRHERNDDMPEM